MKTAGRNADGETVFSSERVLAAAVLVRVLAASERVLAVTQIHFFMEERVLDKYPDD